MLNLLRTAAIALVALLGINASVVQAANNLTLTSPTFGTGKFGQGLNGGVGLGNTGVSALPFTLEAFVMLPSNPGAVQVAVGNATSYIGVNANGTPRSYVDGPGDMPASTVNIADGAFHHVKLVGTSAGTTLYVDGVSVSTSTKAPTTTGGVPTSNIGIRRFGTTTGYDWSGTVDAVAMWPTDRSAAAVPTAAYTGSEGMTTLWNLDGTGNDSVGAATTPATAYTLTGPSSGSIGNASSAFTVTASGTLSASVTITPSDGGAGGTFSSSTVALASGTNTSATFTYTPASTGAKTISTTNSGSLTNPASLTYTATAGFTAPIYFSPSNWVVAAGSAKTNASGAYFKAGFSGSTATLNFDVSSLSGPLPQIYYQIDGGPRIQATLAATVALTLPSDTGAYPIHSLQVWVKSTTGSVTRWPGAATTVSLTGITLDSGATLSAPIVKAKTMLVMGDSITEGKATRNASASNDTDQNDSLIGYALRLGDELGAEVGTIGYGGQGVTIAGDGNVPAFPSAYNLILPGVTRTFSPEPDLIVINEGTNDAVKTSNTTTVTSGLVSVISDMLSKTTNTRIVVMQTFGNYLTPQIQAAVSQVGNSRVQYLSTSGLIASGDLSDSYHPRGEANVLKIAPTVANGLRPIMYPANSNTPSAALPQFRVGFH